MPPRAAEATAGSTTAATGPTARAGRHAATRRSGRAAAAAERAAPGGGGTGLPVCDIGAGDGAAACRGVRGVGRCRGRRRLPRVARCHGPPAARCRAPAGARCRRGRQVARRAGRLPARAGPPARADEAGPGSTGPRDAVACRRLGFDRRDDGRRGCDRRRGRLRLGRGRGFGFRLGLGGRRLLLEAAAVGQPADAVGRGLVDARRVALHTDLELVRELDDEVVVDAQLSCELVDPDLLRGQTCIRPTSCRLIQCRAQAFDLRARHLVPQRPVERTAA